MVMGDDSCLRGHGFKSRCCILDDGYFFTHICCKNCTVCLKRPKINENEAEGDHLIKAELSLVKIKVNNNARSHFLLSFCLKC